jgi:hypothetical protein
MSQICGSECGLCCSLQNASFPQIHSHILHPCVSSSQQQPLCGDFFAATSILRFDSFFTQKLVVVSLTIEVRSNSSCSVLLLFLLLCAD